MLATCELKFPEVRLWLLALIWVTALTKTVVSRSKIQKDIRSNQVPKLKVALTHPRIMIIKSYICSRLPGIVVFYILCLYSQNPTLSLIPPCSCFTSKEHASELHVFTQI